ncbi:class I SAM-dependent methyltransferase [Streptomyces sp. FIT100]|uniref:class I SAM-dependent methyltransferase n=1 Tax=Streptomyces sp. FIT100 TaxID=2837956 RepID=UPI0021C8E4E8|nr:class I SAM-dependent methyltransferase [Streptomyces sp. FIT100]UUN30173.1 methyltransferase domain-containing protein [Streptomyces sp. FIT100]
MAPSQYDNLAQLFEDLSELPIRRHLEFPSVRALIGPPDGLRILDFGCGSGVYSRWLAKHGAASVIGLDDSTGMIDYAVRREEQEGLGIQYLAGSLPSEVNGTFDLVLGAYVLPYATRYSDLVGLCDTAARALRPGGRFLTLVANPELPTDPDYYTRYGFRLQMDGARVDGAALDLNLRFNEYDVHVTARYWSAPTLERALAEAGFTALEWRAHRLSEEPEPDAAFFQPYLHVPHAAIIAAVKEAG